MLTLGKEKIIEAFYVTVLTDGFNHTSVKKIMKNANMRRQTFYNYFLDKFDLLTWFINHELSEVIDENLDYLDCSNLIRLTCFEIFSHRNFYKNIIKSQSEIDVTKLLSNHLVELVIYTYKKQGVSIKNHQLIELLILGISYRLITSIVSNDPLEYEEISENAVSSLALITDIS